MLKYFKRIVFSRLMVIVISGIGLFYVFSKINFSQIGNIVQSVNLQYFSISLGVFFALHILLFVRWLFFIKAVGLTLDILHILRNFLIGLFGNVFMPSAIGGDVLRTLGLCHGQSEKVKVFATVFLDRLSGFITMILICCVAFIFGFRHINDIVLFNSILVLMGGTVMVMIILFNENVYKFFCRISNGFPRVKEVLMRLHYDIALLKKCPQYGFLAIMFSVISQVMVSVSYFFLALALHQNIAFVYFLIFIPLIGIISTVPSVGGLGVREAGAMFLFAKIGVDLEIAVSLTLINFLFVVIAGIVGGIVYCVTIPKERGVLYSR